MTNLAHDYCTGCSACYNICPKDAIRMAPDDNGSIYPIVDNEKCTECKVCVTHCPEEASIDILSNEPKQVFAAVNKDRGQAEKSASGGLASILAETIVRMGGVYYGCRMRSVVDVVYQRVDTPLKVNELRGSKYVQARIHTTYKQVREDLMNGLNVIFIGVPCQVAGLRSYLRRDYENMYTIDLICHGTPPQKVLIDYASSVLEASNVASLKVDFRWKKPNSFVDKIIYGLRFYNESKIVYKESFPNSPYITAFLKGYTFRESCYNCRYASSKRVGDITLGDFWGLGTRAATKLCLDYGVSMVLVNTEKGKMLFERCKNDYEVESHTLAEAILSNSNLRHPTSRPENKDKFDKIVQNKGLKSAVMSFIPEYKKNASLIVRIKVKIAKILTKLLR